MPDYKVTWESDITAESPHDAARLAQAAIKRGAIWAAQFVVADDQGVTVEVDMAANDDEDDQCDECLGGSVICDTCDDCGTRHCSSCDPCE